MRIALVTARHVDPAATDDRHLAAALAAQGAAVDWVPWDAPADWPRYDRAVLRSCWDYHRRGDEFAAWLAARERDGTRLVNPPAVVRANLHKRYLVTLADAGLPVAPLRLLPRGSRADLAALAAELGGDDLVVKPAVSATAWRTLRTRLAADPQAELDALLAERDVIVQRFLPAIARGEWSLVFLGGLFSHAVLKRPAAGEFRCQADYGGSVAAASADPALLALAARALQAFAPTRYARLDLVVDGGEPWLMEAELIEPQLFLGLAPGAAARAAAALLDAS